MNAQTVDIPLLRQGDGIVQILGILSVDRYRLPVPQIHAACHIRRAALACHALHLIHDLLRELGRQIIATHDRENIRPRVVHMSQNLYDLSLRLFSIAAEVRQFHHDLMSAHRPFGALLRDKNILSKSRIVRHCEPECLAFFIGTDDPADPADQNLCDLPLSAPSVPLGACQRHLHGIAVKSTVYLGFRNKNILILPLDRHKAKSSRMRGKNACQEFTLRLHVLAL